MNNNEDNNNVNNFNETEEIEEHETGGETFIDQSEIEEEIVIEADDNNNYYDFNDTNDDSDGEFDENDDETAAEQYGDSGDFSQNRESIPDDSIGKFQHAEDEPIYAVATHPQEPSIIASGGGDDCGRLWRLRKPENSEQETHSKSELLIEEIGKLEGHEDSVVDIAFNMDGKYVATASLDATVRVWNVADVSLTTVLEGPGEGVDWIQWHPKGNVLFAGCGDSSAWLWSIPKGTCISVLYGHAGPIMSGTFSSDGKFALTGAEDGTVRVWNPKDSSTVHQFSGPTFGEAPVTALTPVPRQPLIVTGAADGTVTLCHITNGNVVARTQHHEDSVESVSYSPNMPLYASGSLDGNLCIWDAGTNQVRQTCSHNDGVVKVMWHPDQPVVFTGSLDGRIRLWDGRSGDSVRTWSGHRDVVLDFALSSDQKHIVTGSDDFTGRIFSLQ
eukprot:gb/GECH01001473.1/.p1 GENE.gb/GECH01001473.1/~~gb/GECH01001473.1/.p1  ORF type:complete len:444 (+),score=120.42 gb/GECH01001473.1/:1-1332(+)